MSKSHIVSIWLISALLLPQGSEEASIDWKTKARYAVGLIIQKDGFFITEDKFSISEYLSQIKFANRERFGGTTIYFTDQSFTAEDINELCGLAQIDGLMFDNCKLSKSALAAIPKLNRSLQKLWLTDTKLTHRDFASIAQLTNLEELNLANSSTSLNGILKLSACKKLKRIDISGLGFEADPKASAKIRAAFPDVEFGFSEMSKQRHEEPKIQNRQNID